MQNLIYKGIVFDEYAQDPDGAIWAEVCSACADRYKELICDEIDEGDTACGCCSVKGCKNNGNHDGKHYYIDFIPSKIQTTEIKLKEV